MIYRITPEYIETLKENELFVFGSNLSGIHGAGGAKLAHKKFGAEWGVGVGFTGQCYAIPTKDYGISRTLKIDEIKLFIDEFIELASKNINYNFLVTRIGCGLAGYRDDEIALLFKDVVNFDNIFLPQSFWNIIKSL